MRRVFLSLGALTLSVSVLVALAWPSQSRFIWPAFNALNAFETAYDTQRDAVVQASVADFQEAVTYAAIEELTAYQELTALRLAAYHRYLASLREADERAAHIQRQGAQHIMRSLQNGNIFGILNAPTVPADPAKYWTYPPTEYWADDDELLRQLREVHAWEVNRYARELRLPDAS